MRTRLQPPPSILSSADFRFAHIPPPPTLLLRTTQSDIVYQTLKLVTLGLLKKKKKKEKKKKEKKKKEKKTTRIIQLKIVFVVTKMGRVELLDFCNGQLSAKLVRLGRTRFHPTISKCAFPLQHTRFFSSFFLIPRVSELVDWCFKPSDYMRGLRRLS